MLPINGESLCAIEPSSEVPPFISWLQTAEISDPRRAGQAGVSVRRLLFVPHNLLTSLCQLLPKVRRKAPSFNLAPAMPLSVPSKSFCTAGESHSV